ncbi:MAG TPA: hypothetical protein VN739_08195, partial [Nitrososphaerales archaeon]|nr:hypothetical protein [Nitrososphaerales archaeon]
MWGITALVAFFLAFSAFGLAFAIQTFGHPFGSPPGVLYALDSAYFVSVASAVAGAFLLWRFLSLRRR